MHRRTRKRIINFSLFKESYNLDKLKLSVLSGNPDKNLLHSHPKYLKERNYPSIEAEEFLEVTDLSKEYKMPFGLTNIETENVLIIFMHDDEVIKKIYEELIKLNPDLPRSNEPEKMYHIANGAVSKYIPEDIKDFIDNSSNIEKDSSKMDLTTHFNRKDGSEFSYEFLWDNIKNMGYRLKWFPSIDTLDFIYKKMKQTI